MPSSRQHIENTESICAPAKNEAVTLAENDGMIEKLTRSTLSATEKSVLIR